VNSTSQPVFLDTNILIAYLRANSLGIAIEKKYGFKQRADKPLISIVTIGEILAFADKHNWGLDRVELMNELLAELVHIDISDRQIINRYAEIDVALYRAKPSKIIGKNDMWIAACASVTGATLYSTDKDFGHIPSDLLHYVYVDEAIANESLSTGSDASATVFVNTATETETNE